MHKKYKSNCFLSLAYQPTIGNNLNVHQKEPVTVTVIQPCKRVHAGSSQPGPCTLASSDGHSTCMYPNNICIDYSHIQSNPCLKFKHRENWVKDIYVRSQDTVDLGAGWVSQGSTSLGVGTFCFPTRELGAECVRLWKVTELYIHEMSASKYTCDGRCRVYFKKEVS